MLDTVELRAADDRPDTGFGRTRIADDGALRLASRRLPGQRQMIDMHEHPRRRIARLAAVAEAAARAAHDRLLDIGIGQDQVRALAAEFLVHALHGIGGRLRDLDARTRRTRERHHGDIRMPRQRVAHFVPVAVHEVEHAGRHAGLVQDLGEQDRAERRDLARLEHHRAAGRERRRDLAYDLVDRPVPRRDQRAHADRFVRHQQRIGLRAEAERLQRPDRLLEVRGADRGLHRARKGDRRAHFLADRLRDFFVAALVDLEDALQQRDALVHGPARVRVESPLRRADRTVDVGRAADPELRIRPRAGRIDHVDRSRIGGIEPLAIDMGLL